MADLMKSFLFLLVYCLSTIEGRLIFVVSVLNYKISLDLRIIGLVT